MSNPILLRGRAAKLYLTDILQAIEDIRTFTTKMEFEDFLKDKKTFIAVWKCFEIIGEAVKNLPKDMKAKHPEVDWKAIAGMRDKLSHEYFGVSHNILWITISSQLPGLEKAVRALLE